MTGHSQVVGHRGLKEYQGFGWSVVSLNLTFRHPAPTRFLMEERCSQEQPSNGKTYHLSSGLAKLLITPKAGLL